MYGHIPKVVVALACLTVNCQNAADPIDEQTGMLASGEQCHTLAPDVIWNGGGAVTSSATYGRSTCFDGFLIDLKNYSKRFTEGTRVTYGRKVPTNAADCTNISVRTYVWEKKPDGTTTFLGQRSQAGIWTTDPATGASSCSTPSVLLERHIPGYAPGKSYRLGVRAQRNEPYQRREVRVETNMPFLAETPAQLMNHLGRLRQEISALPPHQIHPAVAATMAPNEAVRVMDCRQMQLHASALRVMAPSYTRAGATSNTVNRWVSSVDSLYQAKCVDLTLTFAINQGMLSDQISAFQAVQSEIAAAISGTLGEAAVLIGSVWKVEIQRIMVGCQTNADEVLAFLVSGTVPANMLGPNVLLRSCTGGTSVTQLLLGMSGRPAMTGSLKSCIVEAFNTPREAIKDTCTSDPRAQVQGGGSGSDQAGGGIPECRVSLRDPACLDAMLTKTTDPEATARVGRIASLLDAYYTARRNLTLAREEAAQILQNARANMRDGTRNRNVAPFYAAAGVTMSAAATIETAMLNPDAPMDAVIGRSLTIYAGYLGLFGSLQWFWGDAQQEEGEHIKDVVIPALQRRVDEALKALCEEDPENDLCKKDPNDPQKRCPEWDLASGPVWMDNPSTGLEMNMVDRIEACTCEAIDASSGAFTRGGVNLTLVCQTEDERRRQQCYTDLVSMPNPETCWDYVQPGELNRDALRADMCEKILCPPADTGVVINGVCNCLTNPTDAQLATRCNFNGAAGQLHCDANSGLVCDGLGARCVGFDAGRNPLAPPNCRVPDGIQLGGQNQWGVLNPSDIFTAVLPAKPATGGDDFFMVKQGFISMASPEITTRAYGRIGTALRAEVVPPDSLPSGCSDRGSLQLYCTNPASGIFNRFCGQKEFANLTLGQQNNVDFPLDAGCLACVGDGTTAFRWGFGFRTAACQTQRSAFGGIGWTGTMSNTTNPFPECGPKADPSSPVDPSAVQDLIDDGIIRITPIDGVYATPWEYPSQSGTSSGLVPLFIENVIRARF